MAENLIVFGECLVDDFGGRQVPGGAPFNVARHLRGLGLDPLFITRIGADATGEVLLAEMHRLRLRTAGVQFDSRYPSGTVRVHEEDGGHRFEILPHQAYDAIDGDAALAAVGSARDGATLLYFGTLAQRANASRAALGVLLRRLGARTLVDLNWRSGQVDDATLLGALDQADTLKVSVEELELLLRIAGVDPRDAASLHAAPGGAGSCAALLRLLSGRRCTRVIVTYGALGHGAWAQDGSCLDRGPGVALGAGSIADTVGAGDAFTAVVLAGQVLEWPLERTLARANAFAAQVCTVRGAVPADDEFYPAWRRRWEIRD